MREMDHVEESDLRKGPWTLEEDSVLVQYIASHGEGNWNQLARSSGLRRSGKSCRLRWLNYLKPDVKRGNLTPEEQLLILDLHSKWGNRWSKIAQYLPGRTDNEIKNYWRTRVLKQARQLNVDANSAKFREAIRCFWMPRLLQQIDHSNSTFEQAMASIPTTPADQAQPSSSCPPQHYAMQNINDHSFFSDMSGECHNYSPSISSDSMAMTQQLNDASSFPTSNMASITNFNDMLVSGEYFTQGSDFGAFNNASTWEPGQLDCSMGEAANWSSSNTTIEDHHMRDSFWGMDELQPMIHDQHQRRDRP